jgi:hypothetical protein
LEVGKIFDTNNLEYQSNNSSTALAEQLLTYKLTAGKHNFDFLGGFTFQKTIDEGFVAKAYDFRSEAEVFSIFRMQRIPIKKFPVTDISRLWFLIWQE